MEECKDTEFRESTELTDEILRASLKDILIFSWFYFLYLAEPRSPNITSSPYFQKNIFYLGINMLRSMAMVGLEMKTEVM